MSKRTIPEFPNYAVTKNGGVWSYPKPRSSKNGMWLRQYKSNNSKQYLFVRLCKNNKVYNRRVHCLVLETYGCKRPNGMVCRHLDGDAHNNNFKNLKWGTYSENEKDKKRHGTYNHAKGEETHCAKLSEQDVRTIVYMYKTGEVTQKKIADIYNVDPSDISRIVNKKYWKHIWS